MALRSEYNLKDEIQTEKRRTIYCVGVKITGAYKAVIGGAISDTLE